MVVTEMYQMVSGGQETNRGSYDLRECRKQQPQLQNCNLVVTKPSTVGTIEEEWRGNEMDEKRGETTGEAAEMLESHKNAEAVDEERKRRIRNKNLI